LKVVSYGILLIIVLGAGWDWS